MPKKEIKEKSDIAKFRVSTVVLLRLNKRGKTCVLLLDSVVEATLKFPTSKELLGFINTLPQETK